MASKKTVVLGASTNPTRYSHMAVTRLLEKGHEVVPVGIKKGEIEGLSIINHLEIQPEVDTVSLYIGPKNQEQYVDYLLETKPQRVIFNPGTFNQDLMSRLEGEGVEVMEACTLVMLSANTY